MDTGEMWLWSEAPGNYSRVIESAIIELQEEEGISVRLESRSWENYVASLMSSLVTAGKPDVFSIEPGAPLQELVQKGLVLPLSDYFNVEELKDNLCSLTGFNSLLVDDILYSFPISMNNMQLFVNLDILNRFNLDLPKEVEDLFDISDILRKSKIDCISTGFRDFWAGIDLFVVLVKQMDKEGELLSRAERGLISWNNDIFCKVFNTIHKLASHNVLVKDVGLMDFHNDAFKLWIEGKALFLWPANNSIISAIPEFMNYDCLWFPPLKNCERILTGGVALSWSIASKSHYVSHAIKLIKKMIDNKRNKLFIQEGITPSLCIEENVYVKSRYQVANKMNADQKYALDRRIYNPKVYNLLGEVIRDLSLLKVSPTEGLQRMDNI